MDEVRKEEEEAPHACRKTKKAEFRVLLENLKEKTTLCLRCGALVCQLTLFEPDIHTIEKKIVIGLQTDARSFEAAMSHTLKS